MKSKEFMMPIHGKPRTIKVSPLTMQFIAADDQFQNVARTSIELFWNCNHWGEDEQPETADQKIEWLCANYEVSPPELIRTCIAWRDGYLDSRD